MKFLTYAIMAISWFTPKPYTEVYVKDCGVKFKTLYADDRATTPLPNPFLSDAHGNFTFFTSDDCTSVSIDGKKYYIFQVLPARNTK